MLGDRQPRSTQRRVAHVPDDEAPLTQRIIDLACEYGRYGYRRVTGLQKPSVSTCTYTRRA